MTGMSQDELRGLIAQVVAEQRDQHGYEKREPLVRFKDPEGKPWYSATVSRIQALTALLALLGMVGGVVWATMGARDRLEVFPTVQAQIRAAADLHEAQVASTYATKRELERAISAMESRGGEDRGDVRVLQEQVVTLKAQTARIEEKLDRLLARR
ncbi:MAG: hypothetical protein BWX64_01610 [Acidobacteria bacterium ADurb.Bin051]|jgi:hypothetical protein|nr:MAG: hypothetical protein BWX64_01610 [Acidobacteria bacterium ADurb.Bin051]